MKIYFDTNLYSYIREKDETKLVRQFLENYHATLVGSSANLFELYAIPDESIRRQEIAVFAELVDQYEPEPISWLHACELRKAIKKLRPEWLRRTPTKNQIVRFKEGHRSRWNEAKAGNLPPAHAFEAYKRDFHSGYSTSKDYQQSLRRHIHGREGNVALISVDGRVKPIDMRDPEIAWRIEGMFAWQNAIEKGASSSRDYADWLGPFLRAGSFKGDSYKDFWIKEVPSHLLPLNRITGLTCFYQLSGKITHGNSQDQLHANHWLLTDLFLTADRRFFESLQSLASKHFPERRFPELVIRAEESFARQLEAVLIRSPGKLNTGSD